MARPACLLIVLLIAGLAGLAGARCASGVAASASSTADASKRRRCASPCVRVWKIHYRTHAGVRRRAYVVLPRWYGPWRNPVIPLVISPHGRGVPARTNVRLWGVLPAYGPFAVVNPQGEGRRVPLYSWGYSGQIRDLARMPRYVRRALPWLRIDRARIYAFGSSMGAQESLLLVARHPKLLAGVAAYDAATDMARRYRDFPRLACARGCRRTWRTRLGLGLRALARIEIGGSPESRPYAYRLRSPIEHAWRLAHSGVPIELWWSRSDRIVVDQHRHSERLLRKMIELNPYASVEGFVGSWSHSAEVRNLLVHALIHFNLLPSRYARPLGGIRRLAPPSWPSRPLPARPPGD